MKTNYRARKNITIHDFIKDMDEWSFATFLSLYDDEIPREEQYETLCLKCKPSRKIDIHSGKPMLPCEADDIGECPYGNATYWWINQPVESSHFFRCHFLTGYDDEGNKIEYTPIYACSNVGDILAKKVRELRTDAGKSQQQLADALEVKRETVKFWESGARQIKATDLAKLALYFEVSVDFLLGLQKE